MAQHLPEAVPELPARRRLHHPRLGGSHEAHSVVVLCNSLPEPEAYGSGMPGSPLRSRQSAAYSRALQVVPLVIAGVILGRQAAGGFPTVEIGRRLLLVRVTGAAVELTIAALCRPRRPVATLRWFAYLIGTVTAATILAVIAVQPSLLWEGSA